MVRHIIQDKRGWLRIVEATFAVLIVIGVLFFLSVRNHKLNETDLSQLARSILDELATNQSTRTALFNGDKQSLDDLIVKRIPGGTIEYELRICDLDQACGKTVYVPGNVYVAERVFSTTINKSDDSFAPKKLRLFLWRVQPGN